LHNKALARSHENDEFHSRWIHKTLTDDHAKQTLVHATQELRRIAVKKAVRAGRIGTDGAVDALSARRARGVTP